MRATIVILTVIVAVCQGVTVQEARNVELVCVKEDECLKACDLLFLPSHIRDEKHLKYQEKHNNCIKAASGDTCERNEQIKDCFIAGEDEVNDLTDDEMESFTIYWHETLDL